jgi:hypothetical protein
VALAHLRLVVQRGLDKTAPLWPELREASAWGREAAQILANPDQVCAAEVRERYEAWLRTLTGQQAREGWLGQVVTTFLKVSANYLDGLFHCYDVPDLPSTNNDLERRFGTLRYHERRASGRRAVSGRLVLRGAVRVVAILDAAQPEAVAEQLRLKDREAWQRLREQLDTRAERRRAQRRFRRDPPAYLAELEQQLLK